MEKNNITKFDPKHDEDKLDIFIKKEKKTVCFIHPAFCLGTEFKTASICPFVSEKLWQELNQRFFDNEEFPKEEEKPSSITDRAERKAASTMINLIDKIRTVQGENLIKQQIFF